MWAEILMIKFFFVLMKQLEKDCVMKFP